MNTQRSHFEVAAVCAVCGWDTHATAQCSNRARLTQEVHMECFRQWTVAMNVHADLDTRAFLRQNTAWLVERKVDLLKAFLELPAAWGVAESRKYIQNIYQYLALMAMDTPEGVMVEEMEALIDMIEGVSGFSRYLHLIERDSIATEWEDVDEEEGDGDGEGLKGRHDLGALRAALQSAPPLVEKEECAICYDPSCIATQCGHAYCEPCVFQVLERPSPQGEIAGAMCRAQVTQYACDTQEGRDRLNAKMSTFSKSGAKPNPVENPV